MKKTWIALLVTAMLGMQAQAEKMPPAAAKQPAAAPLAKEQPINISSDKLDVLQNEHKAIFTGNVIATQGTTNMRSHKMTVYYRDASAGAATPDASGAQGISRIDAEGDVVFTTPGEAARGTLAVYHVDDDTIDLTGPNVTLTREGNILKGTHLIYNMATGRSVLTSGNGAVVGGKPARVRGLFVPKSAEKTKPAVVKKTPDTPSSEQKVP